MNLNSLNPIETKGLLLEIKESGYEPTRWESKFLRSIEKISDEGTYIKNGQVNFLNEILKKALRNMEKDFLNNKENNIWTIICPGPSMDQPGRFIHYAPGRLVAVNTAVFFPLPFDYWAISDPELFEKCLLRIKDSGGSTVWGLHKHLTIFCPGRLAEDVKERYPHVDYLLSCFQWETYPYANYDDLSQTMPFGRELDWRAYTFLTALAFVIKKGAGEINVYGADLCGEKYSRVGIVTERTNTSQDRWRHERELFGDIQSVCFENRISIKLM